MTGRAREHEVRILGFGLAALAVLAAFLAIWSATAIGEELRASAEGAPVTQSDGPLGLGVLEVQ